MFKNVSRPILRAAAILMIAGFTGCLHPKAAYLNDSLEVPIVLDSVDGKICFIRGDFIYLKDLVSEKEIRLIKGQSPEISPDGKKVLFMSGESDDATDPWRIRLLDLDSNRIQEFPNLSGQKAHSAIWSNDGSKIAFQTVDLSRGGAIVGLLDPVSGQWKTLVNSVDLGVSNGDTFTFDSWVKDDRSILVHSLEKLYEVSVAGTPVWELPIVDLGVSSETRFSLSSDKKHLLFDSTIDSDERPVNDALNMLDISTKKITTITPNTVEARKPRWLPTEKQVIFGCMKRFDHPHQSNVCTIGIDGESLSVLIKNATSVSYSSR